MPTFVGPDGVGQRAAVPLTVGAGAAAVPVAPVGTTAGHGRRASLV